MADISLAQFEENFKAGKYDATDTSTQCSAGWYDWFCKDTSLAAKTQKLAKKYLSISASPKINKDTMYIFFKNNCPMSGSLYDDFRICDLVTGNVIYTVVPSIGYNNADKGKAAVYGRENGFDDALAIGTWKDIKTFFGV